MGAVWNPWHGCRKYSEGCENCYMFYLDQQRGHDGGEIYRVKTDFNLPLKKNRAGEPKIPSGSGVFVCMTSDFFLEEADAWRDEVWEIMRRRPDLQYTLVTKRVARVQQCLPPDWGSGWPNVMLYVTVENQKRAAERMPLLQTLPFRHKGVMAAPLLGELDLRPYLEDGQIEQVLADGENYAGARPCRFEWVESLYRQCVEFRTPFEFVGTGNLFIKDGKTYKICKAYQHIQAKRSGLQYPPLPHVPSMQPRCAACRHRDTCNGCRECGKCGGNNERKREKNG